MTGSHTHLHVNVQRTMTRAEITADMAHAFKLGADTIGMCELETGFHHSEFKRFAAAYGYDVAMWTGAAGALALAVKRSYGEIFYEKSTFAAPGKKKVSPNRYVNRVRVKRLVDGKLVMVNEHHAYSSGWTGSKAQDALRQARWYLGMTVLRRVNRGGAKHNEIVIGGGDLNRPPNTFRNGKPLPSLLSKRGLTSTGYVHTDGTHGKTIFDYVWFLSKTHKVVVTDWSTPSFNSDHDGILATFAW